jgi:hypothetical protein
MRAGVAARARFAALGRARAARHGRVDDSRAARAGQLLKAHTGAGLTVALVTQLLTPRHTHVGNKVPVPVGFRCRSTSHKLTRGQNLQLPF